MENFPQSSGSAPAKPTPSALLKKARPTAGLVNLDSLLFAAKFDFLTLQVDGFTELPELSGKVQWSAAHHFKRVTLHDPSAEDLVALANSLGPVPIAELEVAVDLRARPSVPMLQRESMLRAVMVELFAVGLDPSRGHAMKNDFRGFYRRLERGFILRPFNRRLPRHSDQQLHGRREDDAQVKCYLKRRDHGQALAENDYVARVEVRLAQEGLSGVGIQMVDDLFDFELRKRLMPYFTHVKGTTRRAHACAANEVMQRLIDHHDRQLWKKAGIGAFKEGGKGDADAVRLVRDTTVNNRIGQCMTRLEKKLRATKFVRLQTGTDRANQALARAAAELEGLGMTS